MNNTTELNTKEILEEENINEEEFSEAFIDSEEEENVEDKIETEAGSDSCYDGKSFDRKILSYSVLSKEEEEELAKDYFETRNPEAREALILHNQKLVAYAVNMFKNSNVSYEDLFQEGNIGLMRAVELYDYRKGNKFSTYAMWWIRQAIMRAIDNQQGSIRVPVHMHSKINKMQRCEKALTQKYGRTPTTIELAAAMNLKPSEVEFLQETSRNMTIVSLSTPIGDSKESIIEDIIPDTKRETDPIKDDVNRDYIGNALLTSLTDKEAVVIIRRFGLNGNEPETLETIGNDLGVSRERIRQIQDKALRKLRHNKDLKELFGTYYN